MNGQEHLGTFESERSNALERIVENGHGTLTVMSQYGHVHAPKTKELKGSKKKESNFFFEKFTFSTLKFAILPI
jgi:hypothetical protein